MPRGSHSNTCKPITIREIQNAKETLNDILQEYQIIVSGKNLLEKKTSLQPKKIRLEIKQIILIILAMRHTVDVERNLEKAVEIINKYHWNRQYFDEPSDLSFLAKGIEINPLRFVLCEKELAEYFDIVMKSTNLALFPYLSMCINRMINNEDKEDFENCQVFFKKMIACMDAKPLTDEERDAFLHHKDKKGKNAFFKIIEKKEIPNDLAFLILNKTKNQDYLFLAEDFEFKNSPLHIAANRGNMEILNALLRSDSVSKFINSQNAKGATALYHAVFEKQIECAKALLEYEKTDPTIQTYEKRLSSLHLLAMENKEAFVALFKKALARSKNIDQQTITGATPFLTAAFTVNTAGMICLMEKNADIAITMSGCENFLHILADDELSDEDVIKIITTVNTYYQENKDEKEIQEVFSILINQKNTADLTPLDVMILHEKRNSLEFYLKVFHDYITRDTLLSALLQLTRSTKSKEFSQYFYQYLKHICDEKITCILDSFIRGSENNYFLFDGENMFVVSRQPEKYLSAWKELFEKKEESPSIGLDIVEDFSDEKDHTSESLILEKKITISEYIPESFEFLKDKDEKFEQSEKKPLEIHKYFQEIKKEKMALMKTSHRDLFASEYSLTNGFKLTFKEGDQFKNYLCMGNHGDITYLNEEGEIVICVHPKTDYVTVRNFFLIHKNSKLNADRFLELNFLQGISAYGLHLEKPWGFVAKPKGRSDKRLFGNTVYICKEREGSENILHKLYVLNKISTHSGYKTMSQKSKKIELTMVVTPSHRASDILPDVSLTTSILSDEKESTHSTAKHKKSKKRGKGKGHR